jgi:hypothetical protein
MRMRKGVLATLVALVAGGGAATAVALSDEDRRHRLDRQARSGD